MEIRETLSVVRGWNLEESVSSCDQIGFSFLLLSFSCGCPFAVTSTSRHLDFCPNRLTPKTQLSACCLAKTSVTKNKFASTRPPVDCRNRDVWLSRKKKSAANPNLLTLRVLLCLGGFACRTQPCQPTQSIGWCTHSVDFLYVRRILVWTAST